MSQTSKAYDSDQESIDMNDLPDFGIGHEGETTTAKQTSVSIGDLLDAENAEIRTSERLEEIAKEMKLFTLDETECANMSCVVFEEKHTVLQPPAIPFFTSSPLQLYSQDTLICPLSENNGPFQDFTPYDIQEYFKEGYLMRHSLSKRKPGVLLTYVFHVMSCTKDTELMHSAFRTLKYLTEANVIEGNLFKDVLLALANLGGDISKFGKDISTLSSPVVKSSTEVHIKKEKPHGLFKENKILILRFLAVHLRSTNSYSPSEVDDLLKICLAVSLDPLMLDNGYANAKDIFNVLSFYPSTERFEERMMNLVKDISLYCDYHHHIIAHVCSYYLPPVQKYGITLRSSLAFHQAEISLERGKSNSVLINVSVGDVLDLVREQSHVFSGETDSSLLLSVIILLDVCINDEPLPVDQRAKLQELCNTLELTIRKRRGNIDDQNTLHLNSFINRFMVKWKQKAGSVTRQQTLMEMKGSYTSPGCGASHTREDMSNIE